MSTQHYNSHAFNTFSPGEYQLYPFIDWERKRYTGISYNDPAMLILHACT